MAKDFFQNYAKNHKVVKSIPGLKMNIPLVFNTHQGTLGLEIEVEATNHLPTDGQLETICGKQTGVRWTCVRDGSLRGHSMEYIFNKPSSRVELTDMIEGLFASFKAYGTVLNNSNRCSTHVHRNMSGLKINQITSIIVLWGVYEQALIDWCGEERKTNHFCLSLKDAVSVRDAWEKYLKTGNVRAMERNLKYSALNILPLWSKGSLEFRCGRAADDPSFPIQWATFIDAFCQYTSATYENPASIAHDLSELGAFEILTRICATDSLLGAAFADEIRNDLSVDQFNDMCIDSFRIVQALSLGFPWNDWLPLINKPHIPNPFAVPTEEQNQERLVLGERRQPLPMEDFLNAMQIPAAP